MGISYSREFRSVLLSHKTWVAFVRLCRSTDGRWNNHGKLLPRFGYMKEERVSERDIDEVTHRMRHQQWRQWWCPYLLVGFARNTHDLIIVTKSDVLHS